MLVALARPPVRSIGSMPTWRRNQPTTRPPALRAGEQLGLGREGHPAPDHRGQHEGVAVGDVVADQDRRADLGDVLLAADPGSEHQPDHGYEQHPLEDPIEHGGSLVPLARDWCRDRRTGAGRAVPGRERIGRGLAVPRLHRLPGLDAAVGRAPGRTPGSGSRCPACPATARRGRSSTRRPGPPGTPRSTALSSSSPGPAPRCSWSGSRWVGPWHCGWPSNTGPPCPGWSW